MFDNNVTKLLRNVEIIWELNGKPFAIDVSNGFPFVMYTSNGKPFYVDLSNEIIRSIYHEQITVFIFYLLSAYS